MLTYQRVYDKNKTAYLRGVASIVLLLRKDGKRRYVQTGIQIPPDQWNSEDQIVRRSPYSAVYNEQLDAFEQRVIDIAHELRLQHGDFYELDELVERLRDTPSAQRRQRFTEYIEERIRERPLADGTRRQHLVMLDAVRSFGGLESFAKVTTANIRKFDLWLRERRGLTHQVTIASYHRRLKVYVHEAMRDGFITKDPYLSFRVKRGESHMRKFLSPEELEQIRTTEIEDKYLQRTRDVFLFQTFTGLAYADLAKFDYTQTSERDGMIYLRQQRQKTQTEYFIYLLPPAVEVLKKYDYKLPLISAQKYNVYLKALALACGVRQRLTSHMARHTFATTVALANGIPLHVLQKMLGHTSIKTTQIYAKVLAEDVERAFAGLQTIYQTE